MRARIVLALLIAVEALGLAVVVTRVPVPSSVDWGDPLGWLARTDPETATLVLGRLLAVGVAGWLLVTTVVALVARLAGAAWATRLAPGAIRHLVEAAVAVGVVATTVAPAAAAVSPLVPVRDGRAPVAPAAAPATIPVAAPPPTAPPTEPEPRAEPEHLDARHRVVAGEHLWGIAETVVRSRGRAADPGAVDRYWRALCDANRDRLASGDPNIVLPGEELDLPPVA